MAHDDLPYGAGNTEDIYQGLKDKGMWVSPTHIANLMPCDAPTYPTSEACSKLLKNADLVFIVKLWELTWQYAVNVKFLLGGNLHLIHK